MKINKKCCFFIALIWFSLPFVPAFADKNSNGGNLHLLSLAHSRKPFCAIYLHGEITQKLADEFIAETEQKRDPVTCKKSEDNIAEYSSILFLGNSPGGDLSAAFQIMRQIQARKIITWLDIQLAKSFEPTAQQQCFSSCALIFASGVHRHYSNDTQKPLFNQLIGIHKPRFLERTYDYVQQERKLDELKYQMVEFFKSISVDPRFVIKMFEVENKSVKLEDLDNLLIWRVVTSLETPPQFD